MEHAEVRIGVVEDDAAMRDSLVRLLRSEGLAAEPFATAEAFLSELPHRPPRCVLADLRLPGMSGIELLHAVMKTSAATPVLIITGHGDIPQAVAAVKAGAFDFIEKPFDPEALVASVRRALDRHAGGGPETEIPQLAARAADLSPREREVMALVVKGQHNKAIAAELGISPRTVEIYRANVMTKMGARNLADLIGMALRLKDRLRRDT